MKTLRGMHDIYGDEIYKWQYAEEVIKNTCARFNFNELRTPIIEHAELFQRSVGEDSDIVQKEMYTFVDKGNRNVTLKPEGTAAVVRACIEHNLFDASKFYYISPMFRYERPQAGRFRQFHQFGAEYFGIDNANADAEMILLSREIILALGIQNVTLNINSIGDKVCREQYNFLLREFISHNLNDLCEDCHSRYETNPLRIIDCKNQKCREVIANAPVISNALCDDCNEHFKTLQQILTELGVDFVVNPKIVRGLDYYTKTVFEFQHDGLAICGGGRYDDLVHELDNSKTISAVGFGFGMERLISLTPVSNFKPLDVFIATIGVETITFAQQLAYRMRQIGLRVDYNNSVRSLKSQIKHAFNINAKHLIVIGEDELNHDINIKNLSTKEEMKLNDFIKQMECEKL